VLSFWSTPALLAARGITNRTSRSQSRSHAFLFCVLPNGLSRKGETVRSLWPYAYSRQNILIGDIAPPEKYKNAVFTLFSVHTTTEKFESATIGVFSDFSLNKARAGKSFSKSSAFRMFLVHTWDFTHMRRRRRGRRVSILRWNSSLL